jgi:hypothetical protein
VVLLWLKYNGVFCVDFKSGIVTTIGEKEWKDKEYLMPQLQVSFKVGVIGKKFT